MSLTAMFLLQLVVPVLYYVVVIFLFSGAMSGAVSVGLSVNEFISSLL